jgi:hypothetical protein
MYYAVPSSVKKQARRAKRITGEDNELASGWVSISKLREIRKWFAQNIYSDGYVEYMTWKRECSTQLNATIVAWLSRGGYVGYRWVSSKRVQQLLKKNNPTK